MAHLRVDVDVSGSNVAPGFDVDLVCAVVAVELGNVADLLAQVQLVLDVEIGQGFERGRQTHVALLGLCARVPELEGDVLALVACLQKGADLLSGSEVLQIDDAVIQRCVGRLGDLGTNKIPSTTNQDFLFLIVLAVLLGVALPEMDSKNLQPPVECPDCPLTSNQYRTYATFTRCSQEVSNPVTVLAQFRLTSVY